MVQFKALDSVRLFYLFTSFTARFFADFTDSVLRIDEFQSDFTVQYWQNLANGTMVSVYSGPNSKNVAVCDSKSGAPLTINWEQLFASATFQGQTVVGKQVANIYNVEFPSNAFSLLSLTIMINPVSNIPVTLSYSIGTQVSAPEVIVSYEVRQFVAHLDPLDLTPPAYCASA
jgi:hypothetical protein